MDDRKFDALLRRALMDAAMEDARPAWEGAEAPDIQWSPRYRRRMRRLLNDPYGTVKRLTRPMWKKVLQTAACVVLATVVALGGLLAVSPTARAKVWALVGQWFETNTEYRFHGSAVGYAPDVIWRPTYLPAGFSETEADEVDPAQRILFTNTQGETIVLEYQPIQDGMGYGIDNEHSDFSRISIHGNPADLYISNTESWPNFLLWTDENERTAFLLTSEIESSEIILIAESVAITK